MMLWFEHIFNFTTAMHSGFSKKKKEEREKSSDFETVLRNFLEQLVRALYQGKKETRGNGAVAPTTNHRSAIFPLNASVSNLLAARQLKQIASPTQGDPKKCRQGPLWMPACPPMPAREHPTDATEARTSEQATARVHQDPLPPELLVHLVAHV